jgi:hypothetical protein
VTAVEEIDNEIGVGPCGKSNDVLLLCELIKDPPDPSQSVVAFVYGAAAVVPSAKAVATARPAVWPPAIPAPAMVVVEAVVAVRSPNASEFPFSITKSMLSFANMTPISLAIVTPISALCLRLAGLTFLNCHDSYGIHKD